MSVQYYRKFAKYRAERSPDLQTEAEFVIPSTVFHGDTTEFMIKLIRICRRQRDGHFIAKESLYKFDPKTNRFKQFKTEEFDKILRICQRYAWLFDEKYLAKLAKAGLVIPLRKANEKNELLALLIEIKASAAAALL